MTEFQPFGKIPRFKKMKCLITEKIDGTNAQVFIGEDGEFSVGSRNRWISPEDDNYGFARWAYEHQEDLLKLGPGRHFGEWWGPGIQRAYGLKEKKFSLFNTGRWSDPEVRPECCDCVPILGLSDWHPDAMQVYYDKLMAEGSVASPGFMRPEGIIIYTFGTREYFKMTDNGDKHKGAINVNPDAT